MTGRERVRYFWMLVGVIPIAVVCGYSTPLAMIRGVILGVCLSLGVIRINCTSRELLNSGSKPPMGDAVDLGIVMGVVAAIALAPFSMLPFYSDYAYSMFRVDPSSVSSALTESSLFLYIIPACAYGMLILGLYASRGYYNPHNSSREVVILRLFALIIAAGFVCGALAVLPIAAHTGFAAGFYQRQIIIYGVGGAVFCFLWLLLMALADPAWSSARWQRVTSGAENDF